MVLFAIAATGLGGLGWLVAAFEKHPEELSRHAAPDGRMDLVVYGSSAMFAPDPTRELRVHTRNGLLSRESYLGCVNLDSDRLYKAEWVAPRTVRVHTRGETVDITVNDRGQAGARIHAGC